MQARIVGREDFKARVAAHLGYPEIAQIGKARGLVGGADHFVEVERVWNGEGSGEIGRSRMDAVIDRASAVGPFGYVGGDRFKTVLANVHDADAERRADPFVHIEADEIRAEIVYRKVQLAPGMGGINDTIDAPFASHGDNLAYGHDEARAVTDMGQQEQAHLRIGFERIGIEGEKFVMRDGFRNGEAHDGTAIALSQRIHRGQHGIIVEIGIHDRISRLQPAIAPDQALKGLGGAAREHYFVGAGAE